MNHSYSPNGTIISATKLVCIILAFGWLTACAQTPIPRHPVITEAYISPDPVVGEIVTLHIEATSGEDAPDARIDVLLPDEINLVSGDLVWRGSLTANQPQMLELSICVLHPGKNWRIFIGTSSKLSETSSIGDSDILHIESTADSARVIPSAEYRVTESEYSNIWPIEITVTPTPVPPTVSAECSGIQK